MQGFPCGRETYPHHDSEVFGCYLTSDSMPNREFRKIVLTGFLTIEVGISMLF